jgi:alpha-galactosidase
MLLALITNRLASRADRPCCATAIEFLKRNFRKGGDVPAGTSWQTRRFAPPFSEISFEKQSKKLSVGLLIILLFVSCCGTAYPVTPFPGELNTASNWFSTAFDANAQLPFSFVLDGQSSSNLLANWQRTETTPRAEDHRNERIVAFRDPKTGLEARCVAIAYDDFPTVEWTLYFKNTGSQDTPVLSDIHALDLQLSRATPAEFLLHHAVGSPANLTDFAPRQTVLGANASKEFRGEGGRPSSADWPYFNLEWDGGGMIVAIAWPGQWSADFSRDNTNGIHIRGGQETLRLKLHPGEEIRSPLVVLQFWSGRDWIDSQNIWRRWMIQHNLPRPGGKSLAPAMFACSSHQFNEMIHANETNQIQFIDRYLAEGLKIDYWWMDTGWYQCDGNWAKVGTWEVDSNRFPGGLKAISDHAHARGVKTLLWFEPERVAQETWLMTNHSDWVIPTPTTGGATHNLFDFGNPAARHWMTDHVDKLLSAQGIGLYREDSNIDPLRFWQSRDTPDRQGVTEMRHAVGHLAYWDELSRRHPDMPIDACASGGRRDDLETLRRAVPRTRSDYLIEPVGEQCHTYGLALWLPYYGTGFMDVVTAAAKRKDLEDLWNTLTGTDSMTPAVEGQSILPAGRDRFGGTAFGIDDRYPFRSAMCPTMTCCLDVRRTDLDYPLLRKLFVQWKQLAPFFLADYYPLSPYSTGTDMWMAWQFNRPESGDGMVQAFRRHQSPYEVSRYPLRGLDAGAHYAVTDVDTGESRDLSGRELMEQGLSIKIPESPNAVIFTYTKTSR